MLLLHVLICADSWGIDTKESSTFGSGIDSFHLKYTFNLNVHQSWGKNHSWHPTSSDPVQSARVHANLACASDVPGQQPWCESYIGGAIKHQLELIGKGICFKLEPKTRGGFVSSWNPVNFIHQLWAVIKNLFGKVVKGSETIGFCLKKKTISSQSLMIYQCLSRFIIKFIQFP